MNQWCSDHPAFTFVLAIIVILASQSVLSSMFGALKAGFEAISLRRKS